MSKGMMDDQINEVLNKISSSDDLKQLKKHTAEAIISLQAQLSHRGVLSNTNITEELKSGRVVITDYLKKNLNPSSYDVRLGEYFYTTSRNSRLRTLNTRNKASIRSHFEGPHQAISNKEWARKYNRKPFVDIGLGEKIIVLEPGERILTHTHEFIGSRGNITTHMQSRSTAGRLGIATCFCAGWGDPGYVNRWTMEVYNLNHEQTVMVVGDKVSQIVFSYTGDVEGEYSSITGSYQKYASDNLRKIIKTWKPEHMLPKPLGKK